METRPLALLLESIHPAADSILSDAGFAIERHAGALEGAKLAEAMSRATVLGIRSKSELRGGFSAKGSLVAVGCFCIGVNQVDCAGAEAAGCAVFNSPFSNTRSVAEMTVAEAVCLFRRIVQKSVQLHGGVWEKSAANSHEVRGRTLGIIGYGHIGSQVSVLAEALGMRVIFHDISRKMALGNAQPRPSLDAVLAEADCVTLHVPETPATRGMIGERELARMKPGAMLINNARGTIVDVGALARALESGRVGGAAVDVFPDEPVASGDRFASPLLGCANAILTPHIGGSTLEAQEAIAIEVAEKLANFWLHGSTESSVNLPQVDLPVVREGQVRILHVHRNVPGVLGRMHTLLANAGVNINAEYLQSNPNTSFVILDVDPFRAPGLVEAIAGLDATIRIRTIAG
jgi:D-3-phosphoglycerate dehydrogenase